jgi:hypothetical protein
MEGDMSHRYQGGVEPPLEELLVDPIVRLVLRRDRINVRNLIRYIDEARHRLLDEDRQTRPLGAAAGCLGGSGRGGGRRSRPRIIAPTPTTVAYRTRRIAAGIGDFVVVTFVVDEDVLRYSKPTRFIERSSEYPGVISGRLLPKEVRSSARTEAALGMRRGAIPGYVGRSLNLDVAGLGTGGRVTMASLLAALRTVAFGHLPTYTIRGSALVRSNSRRLPVGERRLSQIPPIATLHSPSRCEGG